MTCLSILLAAFLAADVTLTDLDGRPHHPLTVAAVKAHVLLFITTDCPIANSYAPEIAAITRDYAKVPLRFYLVHSDPDLTADTARKHAKAYGLTAPILIDRKHQLVKATGVTLVPEVAVVLPGGKIAYCGRIDDLYAEVGKKRPAPTTYDLRNALAAVLAGKPAEPARTQAVGCSIPELGPEGSQSNGPSR